MPFDLNHSLFVKECNKISDLVPAISDIVPLRYNLFCITFAMYYIQEFITTNKIGVVLHVSKLFHEMHTGKKIKRQ